MKKFIMVFLFAMLLFGCVQKTNKNIIISSEIETKIPINSLTSEPPYIVGGYQIDPLNKAVGVRTMVGGEDWDGYCYNSDESVVFDSTKLFIFGRFLYLKEHLPVSCDFTTVKIIWFSLDWRYPTIYRDKKYLYSLYIKDESKIDISNHKIINDYIYQAPDGDLYFLSFVNWSFKLKKVVGLPRLDIETLTHIADHYFMDKNGLYYFGLHYTIENGVSIPHYRSKKLEDSNGKFIEPHISRNYFTYGKSVYAITNQFNIEKLKLNGEKIKEIMLDEYDETYFITDGNKTYYKNGNGSYYSNEKFYTDYYDFKYKTAFFRKDLNEWHVINFSRWRMIEEEGEKNIYFNSRLDEKKAFWLHKNIIVKKPDGYYVFEQNDDESVEKIHKVFIFNYDTRCYEELEIDQFRELTSELYIYKNRIYNSSGYSMETELDIDNLKVITHRNEKTEYITDGKKLIYTSGGLQIGKNDMLFKFAGDVNEVGEGIDFESLKVVTKDILIDKNYIYIEENIIALNKLGIEIDVFTE